MYTKLRSRRAIITILEVVLLVWILSLFVQGSGGGSGGVVSVGPLRPSAKIPVFDRHAYYPGAEVPRPPPVPPRYGALGDFIPVHSAIALSGDTFEMGGEVFRLEGIDAPQIGKDAKCAKEAERGLKARDYLQSVLSLETKNDQFPLRGPVSMQRFEKKAQGQVIVLVNGDVYFERGRLPGWLAKEMIRRGLVKPYKENLNYPESRRLDWCQ